MSHQDQIDSLLQRYLGLLDEYTRLRQSLAELQSSVFRDIARANFTAERGLRYGRDHYDERMQALRVVRVQGQESGGDGGDAAFSYSVVRAPQPEVEKHEGGERKHEGDGMEVTAGDEGDAGDGLSGKQDEEEEEDKDKDDKTAKPEKGDTAKASTTRPRDPLRWFGIFVPPALRCAQASSIRAVEEVIPRLVTLEAEMRHVEIEVRRAKKRRAKAASAGREKENEDVRRYNAKETEAVG